MPFLSSSFSFPPLVDMVDMVHRLVYSSQVRAKYAAVRVFALTQMHRSPPRDSHVCIVSFVTSLSSHRLQGIVWAKDWIVASRLSQTDQKWATFCIRLPTGGHDIHLSEQQRIILESLRCCVWWLFLTRWLLERLLWHFEICLVCSAYELMESHGSYFKKSEVVSSSTTLASS